MGYNPTLLMGTPPAEMDPAEKCIPSHGRNCFFNRLCQAPNARHTERAIISSSSVRTLTTVFGDEVFMEVQIFGKPGRLRASM